MNFTFKTKSPFYEKERDNLKCNTVRKLDSDDSRFEDALEVIQLRLSLTPHTIKIINPITQESFERTLTDITYYDERFIFSWRAI